MATLLDPALAGLLPYRDASRQARFVCLGCYRARPAPGECPACGVGMVDLSAAPVRVQLREAAERRLNDRKWREEVPLATAALALTALAVVLLGGLASPLHRIVALALFWPLQRALTLGYARIHRGTAIATFAARRQRLAGELGADVLLSSSEGERADRALASTAGEDPSAMETPRLLEWLGVSPPR